MDSFKKIEKTIQEETERREQRRFNILKGN